MTYVSKNLTSKVIKLFHGEGETLAKIRGDQDKAIQAVLDAMTLACDKPKAEFMKGNAKTNKAREQVKEMFDAIVSPTCSKASAAQYQSCFWIAFEKGIPFSRDLVNKKSEAKAETTKAETAKSGKVISTTRVELDKTLSKALGQARALGLTEFAATMLDHCIESLDGFKETVLAK